MYFLFYFFSVNYGELIRAASEFQASAPDNFPMPRIWKGIEVDLYIRLVDENLFAYLALIIEESKLVKVPGDIYVTTFSNGREEMLCFVP